MFSEIMKRRLRAQVVEGMSACSANTKRSGLSVMEKLFCLLSWEQPLSRLHLSRTALDNIDHRNYSLLQTCLRHFWNLSFLTVYGQSSRPGLRMFTLISHRDPLWVLFSSFFTLHLSHLLGSKLILSPTLADNTQLFQYWHPDQIHATLLTTLTCISDVKTWTARNKLKLNEPETEVVPTKSNRTTIFLSLSPFLFE